MEITASLHSRKKKKALKATTTGAASTVVPPFTVVLNTLPADERLWTHFFYYHYFRWLAHTNGTPYKNPFSRFPAPSAFTTWEEYWSYYSTCFCQHASRKRLRKDDEEEAELLPKLLTNPQEQQLQMWANWAKTECLVGAVQVIDETVDAERDPELAKYWAQRHRLFARFDEGIRLHREGWYSATPEEIAVHIAERCRCDVIIDAFCGAGGNSIQFAFTCNHVIAIDIDPVALRVARHNAKIYGVADRIEFIQGDFFTLIPRLRADIVFLSPPWGGPSYLAQKSFDLNDMPINGIHILQQARHITPYIAYLLPRNSDLEQLRCVAEDEPLEVEHNYVDRKVKTITAYFGDFS